MSQASRIVLTALIPCALLAGCSKKEVKPEPTPVASPAAKAEPIVVPSKADYVVQKGDSLWKISGKDKVLGDSFKWPLLYKANRDQIEDPDLIEPRADLSYDKNYSETDIAEAVKKAKETPKYVPHSTPRKDLPLKY
jgi:hypothetical protein